MSATSGNSFFDRIEWQSDKFRLAGLTFYFQYALKDANEAVDGFVFHKTRPLVEEYADFFATHPGSYSNILELGIWGGGSVVFWNECLSPDKLVGVDIQTQGDREQFRRYVTSRALEGRIKTIWGVDQADRAHLRSIVEQEFKAPLDLVIDDASHQYLATKATFETLFPRLRPGGIYFIEDWGWGYEEPFLQSNPDWREFKPLSDLALELVQLTGTHPPHTMHLSPVKSILMCHGFLAIQRSALTIADPDSFKITP